MMAPNLATRPFLNTRPVWLATAAAVATAVVVGGLLVVSHLASNQELATEIAAIEGLQADHDALDREVRAAARGLDQVPWRSLAARIDGTNTILREHRFSWLDLLQDLEEVLPYDVRLVQVSPKVETDRVQLGLEAVCRTREALLELLDNLIADPRFAEPTPRSETLPERSESTGYELSLTVVYFPDEVAP